jgi:hypothetical protein
MNKHEASIALALIEAGNPRLAFFLSWPAVNLPKVPWWKIFFPFLALMLL